VSDATLRIDISDDGNAGAPGASDPHDADIVNRWQKLTDAMAKATEDAANRAARFNQALARAGSAYAGGSGTRREPGEGSAGGKRFSELDSDSKRQATRDGRPAGVSDAEWNALGRENAKRGTAGARVAGKAHEAATRARDEQEL
jgi:hypothetical protein